jgi:hypothetical protein
MAIPEGAVLEAVVDGKNGNPGIAIYDASLVLDDLAADYTARAIKDGKRRKGKFGTRDPDAIDTIIAHKSGANGPAGFAGLEASVRFVVYHRGWEGAAYTFWVPRTCERDDAGRLVVYRAQSDEVQSWHTGHGMNQTGVGIGFQGNYDGEWDLLASGMPKIDRMPTQDQIFAAPLLVDWVHENYPKTTLGKREDGSWGLTGHWEHGKRVCPGDYWRAWIERKRGEGKVERAEFVTRLSPAVDKEVDTQRFKPLQFQKALLVLKFDPGPIDGDVGHRTRAALEDFQEASGLDADGWYGRKTATALLKALRQAGLADQEKFDDHPPRGK